MIESLTKINWSPCGILQFRNVFFLNIKQDYLMPLLVTVGQGCV